MPVVQDNEDADNEDDVDDVDDYGYGYDSPGHNTAYDNVN